MARDCPDRRRGQDWRNEDRGFNNRNTNRIGGAENELDEFMAGMGVGGSGQPRQAIEYGNGNNEYGGDEQRNMKPWERGPTGAAAPWARNNRDERDGASNAPPPWASGATNGSSYNAGGYNAAPWNGSAQAAPGQASYGYGNYGSAGYDTAAPGAGAPGMNSYGAPGYGSAAPPPPGLGPLFQYGNAGSPPPPPPPSVSAPPPPPGDVPPPPPVSPRFRTFNDYC